MFNKLKFSSVYLLIALFGMLFPSASTAGEGWQHVTTTAGITVTMQKKPDNSFPTFRGEGIISANIYQIVAVMSDIKRYTEWVGNCNDARIIKKMTEIDYVIYSRTDVPWPVSDRDAVYRSKVLVDIKSMRVYIRFKAIQSPSVPLVKGVVRMDDIQGFYHLQAMGPNKTMVVYQVDADPKGWLPKWLAQLATRRLPLDTLLNLRKQVIKTRGWYEERIDFWKHYKWK
jgi:hypothetical protein